MAAQAQQFHATSEDNDEKVANTSPSPLVSTPSITSTRPSKLHHEPINHINQDDEDELSSQDGMDHFGSRFALREKNPVRLAWTAIVIALLVYVASIFLYRFTFCSFHVGPTGIEPIGENDPVWKCIDLIVDVLFWVDLFIAFFTTYKDSRGREVDSLRTIAVNYLSFYFWLNLLACLPEDVFQYILGASQSEDVDGSRVDLRGLRVYRLQRISRLARLARVTRLFKMAQIMSTSHIWKWFQALRGVRVVNFFMGLVWTLHLLACGWYLCAALHEDVTQTWVARRTVNMEGGSLLDAGPFEQWLVSMYFVLTVFTTVGFGDISAGTEAEIAYVALTMLVGAVVHSIIISEVIGVVTSTDEVQKVVAKQLALIDAFAAHTGLASETSKEMKSEISFRARNLALSLGFDKSEMKDLITGKYLPRCIIAKMPSSLFGGHLLKNKFIRCLANIPPRLPCLLALHLMTCDFDAGETIYEMGDYPFNLFLVTSGTFAYVARATPHGGLDAMEAHESHYDEKGSGELTQTTGTLARWRPCTASVGLGSRQPPPPPKTQHLFPYKLFSQKAYFGDIEVSVGKLRSSTARCERRGTTLTLHKKDFGEISELFPHFSALWASRARHNEGFRVSSLAKLNVGTSCRAFAAMKIQQIYRERRSKACPAQRRCERSLSELSLKHIYRARGVNNSPEEARPAQVTLETLHQELMGLKEEIRGLKISRL